MRRIAILALGSRGDVQPFIALAYYLHQAGYAVRMTANEEFEELIKQYGLEYHALPSNTKAMLATPEGQKMLRTGSAIAGLKYYWKHAQGQMDKVHAAAFEASRGADLLLYSGLLVGGASIAEKLGIPSAPVFMIPSYPTREFPVPQGDLPHSPMLNKALYGLALQASWMMFRGAVNRFRTKQLDLPKAPGSYKQWLGDSKTPVLLNYSKYVLPRPADWPDHIHVCGYWFLPPPPGWTPPIELMKFLESGEKPIYIGFGSMSDRNAESKTRAILDAIRQTGQCAVLASGWGGLRADELPRNIYMVDDVPHHWLFERVSMVVHHGGAGTTGAGIRAGIPSVLVPHFADQFFWGRQVRRLGVGTQPIPAQKLTSTSLMNAIQACLGSTSMQECARQLGEKIRREDGLKQTQILLERMIQ